MVRLNSTLNSCSLSAKEFTFTRAPTVATQLLLVTRFSEVAGCARGLGEKKCTAAFVKSSQTLSGKNIYTPER